MKFKAAVKQIAPCQWAMKIGGSDFKWNDPIFYAVGNLKMHPRKHLEVWHFLARFEDVPGYDGTKVFKKDAMQAAWRAMGYLFVEPEIDADTYEMERRRVRGAHTHHKSLKRYKPVAK